MNRRCGRSWEVEETVEAGVEFWRNLKHGPDDGCPATPWLGVLPEPWRIVHEDPS